MMANKSKSIILLGGGGHSRVVAEMIRASDQFEIAGMVDPAFEKGTKVDGIEVLGEDDCLSALYERGIRNISITVGSIKDNSKREELYGKVKTLGFSVPPVIHPRSIISDNVAISEGVQIMAGAILQPGSTIGENSIINTGTVIEHDCKIGSHVHVCPGGVLSGEVTIGDNTFIGVGATIIQGVRIGKSVLIGAGAVVVAHVSDNKKVFGVPAK